VGPRSSKHQRWTTKKSADGETRPEGRWEKKENSFVGKGNAFGTWINATGRSSGKRREGNRKVQLNGKFRNEKVDTKEVHGAGQGGGARSDPGN